MKKPKRNSILPILLLLLLASGCSRRPGGVLSREEMAQLMADIHTGESVTDMNRERWETDYERERLRQAIYERHGVDQAIVDSSLVWYGRNLDEYMEMYDRTIEILEQRVSEMGNRIAAEAAVSVAGDSVDVWQHPRYLYFRRGAPSRTITFRLPSDENWEPGDRYVWRVKVAGNGNASDWAMAAEYADGMMESVQQTFSGDGWREIWFETDSSRQARAIYGYLKASSVGDFPVMLDSVELVRRRINPESYRSHFYPRRIHNYNPEE